MNDSDKVCSTGPARIEGNDGAAAGDMILVVDDSKTVRASARRILETAGYSVLTAADGFEALARTVEHRPSMIIADLMMPRLDGYQVCTLVRNNADFRSIPVILMSSRDVLFEPTRACVAGGADHLSKPFTDASLLAVVERNSGGKRRATRAVAGGGRTKSSERHDRASAALSETTEH